MKKVHKLSYFNFLSVFQLKISSLLHSAILFYSNIRIYYSY